MLNALDRDVHSLPEWFTSCQHPSANNYHMSTQVYPTPSFGEAQYRPQIYPHGRDQLRATGNSIIIVHSVPSLGGSAATNCALYNVHLVVCISLADFHLFYLWSKMSQNLHKKTF